MTKLILEVDPNLWRCVFFLKEDKDGYADQCMLTGVGGCCGDVHLRPPACPLKEDTTAVKIKALEEAVEDFGKRLHEALQYHVRRYHGEG